MGTDYLLDVSVDGETWSHETGAHGGETDTSGWVKNGLVSDMSRDEVFAEVTEFCVRLRLRAGRYKHVRRVLSGPTTQLHIEAQQTGL